MQSMQEECGIDYEYFEREEEDERGGGVKGSVTEAVDSFCGHAKADNSHQDQIIVEAAHFLEAGSLCLMVDPSVYGIEQQDDDAGSDSANAPKDYILGVFVCGLRDGGMGEGFCAFLHDDCHVVCVAGQKESDRSEEVDYPIKGKPAEWFGTVFQR